MTDTPIGSFFRSILLDMLPAFSVVLLALLTTLPVFLPDSIRLGGLLPLIGIMFWTLVRPKNMPKILVFALGIFTDIVTFSAIGVHAFSFVLLQATLKKQRRFLMGQGFWVMWAAFILLAIGLYALTWLFAFALTGATVPLASAGITVALAWGCVPLVLALLSGLHDMIDLFDEPVT